MSAWIPYLHTCIHMCQCLSAIIISTIIVRTELGSDNYWCWPEYEGLTHFKIIRFEHRPLGKWQRIRDLGLGGRYPGKKSTESVVKQENGHFCAGGQHHSICWRSACPSAVQYPYIGGAVKITKNSTKMYGSFLKSKRGSKLHRKYHVFRNERFKDPFFNDSK